jgi:hypothetical protein
MTFRVGDSVRLTSSFDSEHMNEDMVRFMNNNQDRTFRIERVEEDSVKIYRIGFWISKKFLELVE